MLNKRTRDELRRIGALFPNVVESETSLESYLCFITLKYVAIKGLGMKDVSEFSSYNKVAMFFTNPTAIGYPAKDIELIIKNLEKITGENLNVIRFRFSEQSFAFFINNIDFSLIPGWNLGMLNGEQKEIELHDVVAATNYLSVMYYSRYSANSASLALYSLASTLLYVSSDEVFADYVAGRGISTFEITKGKAKKYILYDIVKKNSIILFSILFDIKDFKINIRSLESEVYEENVADKIFMEPPLGLVALSQEFSCDDLSTKDAGGMSIIRAVKALRNNGIAVIAVTGSYLTSAKFLSIREFLMKENLLNAVISLPASWYNSTVKTNLLILSKTNNKEVIFIDASNYKIDLEKDIYINEEGVNISPRINEIIQEKKISAISNIVPYVNVNLDSFSPMLYLNPEPQNDISKEEIKARLATTYEEIARIIKQLSNGV